MSRATALVLASAVLAAGFLVGCALLLPPAWAHDAGEGSWMNHMSLLDPVSKRWCCNENDCAPVPAGGVVEQGDGMLVAETGEVIAHERIIWRAPDGRWWRCRNLGGEDIGKTRCLIGPPRGM